MKSKAICIIGMHRSGTSAVTRAVNLLGAYLGEEADMLPPKPDNPEGFWERNDLYKLHDRMLDCFKKEWDATTPLPHQWYVSGKLKSIRYDLVELIKNNFSDHKLWAWKDPRTTVLLDIWKDVLKELGIDLACLYVIRNPLDVAKSLKRRNGFPYDKSFGIWLNYNLSALKTTASIKRVFISYDRFLNDWEVELRRCADGLGIPWPRNNSELKKKMKECICPDLRHSVSCLDDLEKLNAPRPVIRLYKLLEGVTSGLIAPDVSFAAKVEKMSSEFSSYTRFFEHDTGQLWELRHAKVNLSQQIIVNQRQIANRDKKIDDIEPALTKIRSSMEKERAKGRQELERLQAAIREKDKALEDVRSSMEEYRAKDRQEQERLQASILDKEQVLDRYRNVFNKLTASINGLTKEIGNIKEYSDQWFSSKTHKYSFFVNKLFRRFFVKKDTLTQADRLQKSIDKTASQIIKFEKLLANIHSGKAEQTLSQAEQECL